MRRPMMRRTELPDFCLFTIPSTGQLIILKKGVRGYYASGWDTGNRRKIKRLPKRIIGGAVFLTYRRPP